MSIALDPSEMRPSGENRAPIERRIPSRVGRLALLTLLGSVGLIGLSAGAYSMLSGLAGPPPTKVRMGRVSTDWPDLRDGVPALASSVATPTPITTPPVLPGREAALADSGPAKSPTEALTPQPKPVEAKPVGVKPVGGKPIEGRPSQVASLAPAAKPARLPVIENAAMVPPAPAVALVEKARTAPLVAPTPTETTRARTTTGGTFAALPPTPAEGAAKQKPVPTVARAKPASKPVPAVTEKVAAAQPSQAAEPEAEETEMFGMKVPSLAPMGRKFAEGVEALGNAVKRLPEQF